MNSSNTLHTAIKLSIQNRYFRHNFGDPRKKFSGYCCCQISNQNCKTRFISTTLMTIGGQVWNKKKSKFVKNFNFLCFGCCFSVRFEQISKSNPKWNHSAQIWTFWRLFNSCWKKQKKPRKLNSLKNFAALDALLDLLLVRLVKDFSRYGQNTHTDFC